MQSPEIQISKHWHKIFCFDEIYHNFLFFLKCVTSSVNFSIIFCDYICPKSDKFIYNSNN